MNKKEIAKIRIYGKVVEKFEAPTIYDTYAEVEYTEYNIKGEVVGTGTEDFSLALDNTDRKWAFVYIWEGEFCKDSNRRKFTRTMEFRVRTGCTRYLREMLMNKYHALDVRINYL